MYMVEARSMQMRVGLGVSVVLMLRMRRMRAVMTVAMTVAVSMVPSGCLAVPSFGSNTPEAMAAPCAFLALFAAVFGSPAASTFRKLPCELFPLAAPPVSALPYTTSTLVFATEVAHNNACPILHIALLWRRWYR